MESVELMSSMPGVTLMQGDCVKVMREMPEASVDAVVTDPPYGIRMMGKAWDGKDIERAVIESDVSYQKTLENSDFRAKKTERDRTRGPKSSGFANGAAHAGQYDRSISANRAYQQWCEEWARECLRVLKPGGYLLASGSTRTSHRLTCAIEDAGFEIRDSITWLYGSGFPKSLDVSKAIDKMGGRNISWFAPWLKTERKKRGLTSKALAEHFKTSSERINHGGCVSNWELGLNVPTVKQFNKLCEVLELPFERLEEVEREVVGNDTKARSENGKSALPTMGANVKYETWDLTAPATEDAKQWEGFGTALKPSHEPVIVATKPLDDSAVWDIINANLFVLEARLWSLLSAKDAEENFGLSQVEHEEVCVSAQWTVEEKSNIRDALFAQMDMSLFVSVIHTSLSIVWSWRSILADLSTQESTSTTEMTPSLITDLKTLNYLLSKTTLENIIQAATQADGSIANVLPVAQAFNAVALRLNATRTLSALANATSQEHTRHQDAPARPAHEPIVVARKPLSEKSVARNVLEHGTGALNIDASRIDGKPETPGTTPATPNGNGITHGAMVRAECEQPSGRWPANVVLSHSPECQRVGVKRVRTASGSTEIRHNVDSGFNCGNGTNGPAYHDPDGFETTEAWECVDGCPVAELDRQSGNRKTGGSGTHRNSTMGYHGGSSGFEVHNGIDASEGGASRFFYCAKASRRERGEGNMHPTVKPLALMRYLVKLVTPPRGVVLDPFAGSGSTLVAAIQEGFEAVGIEREPEYIEIAERRVAHARAEIESQPLALEV